MDERRVGSGRRVEAGWKQSGAGDLSPAVTGPIRDL